MAPRIINKDLYYVLRQRMHVFNVRYEKLLTVPKDERLTEDIFQSLQDAWAVISMDTPHEGDDNTNLPDDVQISENSFKDLKEAAERMRNKLCTVAYEKGLGEIYIDTDEKEKYDYTYVASEIFEICLLAVYTYTNIFQQCKYIKQYGFEPARGDRRAEEMAKVLHPGENGMPVFAITNHCRTMMDRPLNVLTFEIDKMLYTNEENSTSLKPEDIKKRPHYLDVKERNDRLEEERLDKLERDRLKIKAQKIYDREVLAKIRDENAQIIAEKRRNPEIGDYSVYDTFRNALPYHENENPPFYRYEHFYAFFEKLGIDEKELNANTLIQAMLDSDILRTVDDLSFFDGIMPIYRQLQAFAFEAAAKRCIKEGTEIDLNRTSRLVDETMAALYCTVNLEGFQRGDEAVRLRAAEILNGNYMSCAKSNVSEWMRAAAIDRAKQYYREKGIGELNANAESVYERFTILNRSSAGIAQETRRLASECRVFKNAKLNGVPLEDAFKQAETRGIFMDQAYALEKRIETRYASVWSKIFRLVSYVRQVNALNDLKKALDIDTNTRIADIFVNDRLDHIAKDFSDPKQVNSLRTIYQKYDRKSIDHVRMLLASSVNGKPLPHVDDEEIVPENEGYDPAGDIKTTHGEYLKQRDLEEKLKREEEERREKERLENEKRQKEEKQLRRQKEEEEEEARRQLEEQIRSEKEELYNEKLDTLQVQIQNKQEELNCASREDEKKAQAYQKKIDELQGKIDAIEELHEQQIKDERDIAQYQTDANNIREHITRALEYLQGQEISEKQKESIKKTAEKNKEKHIAGKAVKNSEKITMNIEGNEEIKLLTQALADITQKLANLQEITSKRKEVLHKCISERDNYKRLAEQHSDKWNEAYKELNKLKKDLQYMKDNKDSIIETGEGLGFNREMFIQGENFRVRDTVTRPSEYQRDANRFTVVCDDEIDNSAVEPPVNGNENGAHKGMQKNI